MWYDPERPSKASGILYACANEYEHDFREYWELDNESSDSETTPEQRAFNRKLGRLGETLRASLHSLHRDSEVLQCLREIMSDLGVSTAAIQEEVLAQGLSKTQIVLDSLSVQLAFEAAGSLEDAEQRALVLLSMVAARPITPRAAAFLDRATKLYLWGFDIEAVVMSAAVLEAALGSVFSEADMRRLGFPRRPSYTASDYIKAAGRSGMFSQGDVALAGQLRTARNATIHTTPGLAIDAESALTTLTNLLQVIFPPEKDVRDAF